MGADEELLLKKIIFSDFKSSRPSDGNGIIEIGGTFQTLLQTFIVFKLGQEGCQ